MVEDLILASASPTRARLLAAAGLAIQVEPAAIDEEAVKHAYRVQNRVAIDCALALAEAKARRIAGHHDRALVIGAARAQLQALRGRTHELATAVCVVQDGAQIWHTVSQPTLTMWEFSDAFLDGYLEVEGAAVLGSVGAYRLEGRGARLFDRVEGDHFAILGLPLLELLGFCAIRAFSYDRKEFLACRMSGGVL